MFIDGRSIPDGSVLEADLAIAGGGAAGISIALALADSGLNILMIESGGLDFDAETQDLYAGENIGTPYAELNVTRLRYFGGSTNHWGGWCRPLEPLDFEARAWIPHSGWPFGRSELDPYYRKAQELVEAGPFLYEDPEAWNHCPGGRPNFNAASLAAPPLEARFFQMSKPTRFGERYRADLEKAPNIRVLLNSNLLEIRTNDEGSQVTSLALACIGGPRFVVRPRRVVLALGGIENPRVLLLSNQSISNGLGNRHDLVGRFFMDHPHVAPGRLLVTSNDPSLAEMAKDFTSPEASMRLCYMPSEAYLREVRGLNFVSTLGRMGSFDSEGQAAESAPPSDDPQDVRAGLIALARSLEPADTPGIPRAVEYIAGIAVEPRPNPESRVMLGETRDRFDQRKIVLDWRLHENDIADFRRTLRAFAIGLGAAGAGYFRYQSPDGKPWPGALGWGNHHMGTTRMADDPKRGVVDAQCRVHGMENLFIAGSSVFPTAGASNPTLTLVALALRLADTLKGRAP